MPFQVVNDPTACSTEKPWAVKTEGTGKVHGCHETEEQAQGQLKALYSSGADKDDKGAEGGITPDRQPEREHRWWR